MFLSQSKPVARFRDKFFFNQNIQKEGLFTFIESTSYITITGYTGSSGNVEIPSQINSKNVRYIDANAFSSKTFIQQVTLPSTLYAIRASAFEGCTGLHTVNFPISNLKTLFENCFKGCTSLLNITFPNSLTKVDTSAFQDCTSLISVKFGSGLETIGTNAFSGCVLLSSIGPVTTTSVIQLKSIGKNAFFGAKLSTLNFDSLNFPFLKSIDAGAFASNSLLQTVVLPTSIGVEATSTSQECFISSDAFLDCFNLQSYIIQPPTSILAYVKYLSAYPNVIFSYDIPSLSGTPLQVLYLFPSRAYGDTATSTLYTIPGDITKLGDNAFRRARNITKIKLPTSLQNIGANCFLNSNIKKIYTGATEPSNNIAIIPDTVSSVGKGAFKNCLFVEAQISSALTSIPQTCFANCSTLIKVVFKQLSPPSVASNAFSGVGFPAYGFYPLGYQVNWQGTVIPNLILYETPDPNAELPFGLTYSVQGTNATITGYTGTSNELVIPSIFSENGITLTVTGIGTRAFQNKISLNSITLPPTLTSIGVQAFQGCFSLTTITIPDSVTGIDQYAFYGTGLTSIIIPRNVTSIGGYVFSLCDELVSISVDPLNVAYSSEDGVLFSADGSVLIQYPMGKPGSFYEIPPYVSIIGGSSFSYVDKLTGVTIPDGVTSINSAAFFGCTSLTSITIPNSVTRIFTQAFQNCGSLGSCTFESNSSLLSLGAYAFSNCTSLTSFTIPDTVTSIEDGLFSGSSSLSNLVIGAGVLNIPKYFIYYCTSLTNLVFPPNVRSISDLGLSNCSLVNVTLPGVISIGQYGLNSGLSLITFSAPNLTHIFANAFDFCAYLQIVYIPSIKYINDKAFWRCYQLEDLTLGQNLISIGASAFEECYNLLNSGLDPSLDYPQLTSIGSRAYAISGIEAKLFIPKNCINLGSGILTRAFDCQGFEVSPENTKYSTRPGSFSNPSLRGPDEGFLYGQSGISGDLDFTALLEIPPGVNIDGGFRNLGDYVTPSQVKYIRTLAFSGLSITSFDSNQVISIHAQAFRGCAPTLETFHVGPVLTDLGPAHFLNMLEPNYNTLEIVPELSASTNLGAEPHLKTGKLSAITVDSNNLYFSEDSGVLLNKNRTKLIAYPNGRPDVSYTIPNTVTTVSEGAFCRTPLVCNTSNNSYFSGGFRISIYGGISFQLDALMQGLGDVIFGPDGDTQGGKPDLKQNHQYLRHLTVPGSIKGVGINTINFNGALTGFVPPRNLTSITLGEGVKTVDIFSFFDVPTLTLPASVDTVFTHIEYSGIVSWHGPTAPWANYGNIDASYNRFPRFGAPTTNFVVHPNNPNFASEDGSLFTKDFSKLIRFNMQTNLTTVTPGNIVTTIGKHAFAGLFLPAWDGGSVATYSTNTNNILPKPVGAIRNIILGPSITTVEDGAFIFSSLASLTFGQNVSTIGRNLYIYSEIMTGTRNLGSTVPAPLPYDAQDRGVIRFLSFNPPGIFSPSFNKVYYPWRNNRSWSYNFSGTPTLLAGFYPVTSSPDWDSTTINYLALESDV